MTRISCLSQGVNSTKFTFVGQYRKLKLLLFTYSPEDTPKGMMGAYKCDNNLLYWSNEGTLVLIWLCQISDGNFQFNYHLETLVDFDLVEGKCYVVYAYNLNESIDSYLKGGPDRFYFEHAYDDKLQEFQEPPRKAREMGSKGKVRITLSLKRNYRIWSSHTLSFVLEISIYVIK